MLILIENEPRGYAWGSADAIPTLLGKRSTGRPQAELWLGTHPVSPSKVAKAAPDGHTLLDLIREHPSRYGVGGGSLPFLLKILAIDSPLSLQAHPDLEQAAAGFDEEEAQGVPLEAPHRNYRDRNHKPELLVALSEVTALSGFRALGEARREFSEICRLLPNGPGKESLEHAARLCEGAPEEARRDFVRWALSRDESVQFALSEIRQFISASDEAGLIMPRQRIDALTTLCTMYPDDPGVLVSILLHVVQLAPGEAIFLKAGELHAYLGGLAVEVMASSDNVLRGGLTEKHVDVEELWRIIRHEELPEPRIRHSVIADGLVSWDPGVADFRLMRATLSRSIGDGASVDAGESVTVSTKYPLTMIVTKGFARIERPDAGLTEIVNLKCGQSLYVSAGEQITLTGAGEVFIATVGSAWPVGSAKPQL